MAHPWDMFHVMAAYTGTMIYNASVFWARLLTNFFESCVWRTVSSQSSHHPQEVLLAQFSLYVHKGGLKPDSFHLFHPLQVENCDSNSRLVVDEDDNDKLSLKEFNNHFLERKNVFSQQNWQSVGVQLSKLVYDMFFTEYISINSIIFVNLACRLNWWWRLIIKHNHFSVMEVHISPALY